VKSPGNTIYLRPSRCSSIPYQGVKYCHHAAVIPVVLIKVRQACRQKRPGQEIVPLAVLVIAALLPVIFWLGRNYILFGDAVGAAASMKSRTWTIKPLSDIFNHPSLLLRDLFIFLSS